MSDPESVDQAATGEADRVVVSYPSGLSGWGRHQIETRSFRAWLRKTLGTVAVGDAWEEFVGVGCCGNTLDVPLRVEAVEDGRRVGEDTDIDYEVREACGIQGGWKVQSEGGPTES